MPPVSLLPHVLVKRIQNIQDVPKKVKNIEIVYSLLATGLHKQPLQLQVNKNKAKLRNLCRSPSFNTQSMTKKWRAVR